MYGFKYSPQKLPQVFASNGPTELVDVDVSQIFNIKICHWTA